MLRSLYSGISGLRSHQTMLDVTGNNIANVNTTGFKASATQFQDTLSQAVQGATGAQAERGGTNPAQIGLGVRVAGITTNFTQGSSQATGRATDTLISGDGLFIVEKSGETLYTRAGAFDFDSQGRLVTPDGGIVQGWNAVNGVINQGAALGNVTLPRNGVSPAITSTSATVTGNLPEDAAAGTELVRDVTVFDASGTDRQFSMKFTRTAGGWDVSATDANGATGTSSLAFTGGALSAGGTMTVGGIAVDMTALTGYSGLSTTTISKQDGRAAGTLASYSISSDGTLVGAFSNGSAQAIARISLATFPNSSGLEKVGASGYRQTLNSGAATLGAPGDPGVGSLAGGALEMSNVDLSQEFTNLIVAQRGFQANARIITTSDEVLQELTNLKR